MARLEADYAAYVHVANISAQYEEQRAQRLLAPTMSTATPKHAHWLFLFSCLFFPLDTACSWFFFLFRGGRWKDTATLSGVSLTATPGKLVAVVGAVGSGKSSLLMSLLGELDPSAGAVR